MDLAGDYDEKAATEEALRLSAHEASEERLQQEEEWELALATRASMGCSPLHSHAEALAFKYWSTGRLGYDDRTSDCFFVLHGSYQADLASRHAFADLAALRGLPPGDADDRREVVLFDNDNDEGLLAVQEDAAEAMAGAVYDGPLACVRAIARIVSSHMGGACGAADEAQMQQQWAASSAEVRRRRGRPIVPAAQLRVGLGVHRALLFKFLADASNVPCRLIGSGACRDALEASATAVVRIGDRELAVDLTAHPGAVLPWQEPAHGGVSAGAPPCDLRPPSMELQKVAIADSAPNLAQISASPIAPTSAPLARQQLEGQAAGEAGGIARARERAGKPVAPSGGRAPTSPFKPFSPFSQHAAQQRQPQQRAGPRLAAAVSDLGSKFGGKTGGAGDGIGSVGLAAVPGSGGAVARRPSESNQTGLDAARRGAARGQGPNSTISASNAGDSGGPAMAPGSMCAPRAALPSLGAALPAATRSSGAPAAVLRALDGEPQQPAPAAVPAAEAAARPPSAEASPPGIPPWPQPVAAQWPAQASQPSQPPEPETASPPARREQPSSGSGATNPSSGAGDLNPTPSRASPLRRISSDVSSQTLSARGEGLGRQQSLADLQRAEAALATQPQPLGSSAQPKQQAQHPQQLDGTAPTTRALPLRRSFSAGELSRGASSPGSQPSQEVPQAPPPQPQAPVSQPLVRLQQPEADEWEIAAEELLMGPRIGIGSFGEVYRGSWRHTDVAVKRLLEQDVHESMVKEFRDEVAIMKRLKHPNVVLFMGACTRPPHLCIVTQFVARGSLFRLLHRTRPPPPLDEKRRLLMALDVARGMHYLHACRPPIVHRDLKSPNLLVDKDFTVKVCDFGLSRVRRSTWISSKSQAGTPEWCAPEVLRSQSYNEKSDVWSFGVVLWELATGQEPWAEASPMQVVGAVGWGGATLDIPDSVDPGLAAIISACWGEPEARPSFGQLITSIRELAAARGLMGPVPQPLSPRPTLQEHSTQQQQQQQRRQQAAEEAPEPQPVLPPAAAAVKPSFADAQPRLRAQQEAGDAAPSRSPRHGVAHDWQQYSRSRQAASADSVLAPPADGPAAPAAVLSTQSLPVLVGHGHTAGAAPEAGSGDALPPLVMPLTAATSLPLSVAEPDHAEPPPGSPPAVNAVGRDIGSGAPAQNGELAVEPSARRLAAEAARVAGTKLVRGINTGIKAGVGSVHAGAAGLVGAVRHNAAVLRSASAKLSPHGAGHGSGHGSDVEDTLQGATPQTAKDNSSGHGGPFSWVQLHRRASESAEDSGGSGRSGGSHGGRLSRQASRDGGGGSQSPRSSGTGDSPGNAAGSIPGSPLNPRSRPASRSASGGLPDIEEQRPCSGDGSP